MQKLVLANVVAAAGMLASVYSAFAIEVNKPKAVVELFTSQGCYSCPPADKILGKFAEGDEVLGLSWHVDYWNYLGWQDTFSSRENSERQYRYKRTLKESQVYTPQAIINGRTHAVGSNKPEILSVLKYFESEKKAMNVPIDVSVNSETISVSIGMNEEAKNATLYMVYFNETETVDIPRGENAGKKITYHNVVHAVQPMGMVKAEGLKMNYPISELVRMGFDATALILQKSDSEGNPSAIVGASVIKDFQ